MKIAVLGATGMAGSAIVAEALTRRHRVTAASRRPDPRLERERLVVRAIDIADVSQVTAVLSKADAAVLAVRLEAGKEHGITSLTRGVLDAAAKTHTRVLIVGGSAPLRSPEDPGRLVIDEPNYVPEAWQPIARASLDQFAVCTSHLTARWVYLSPPAVLESDERTGRYRRGTTTLLTDANGQSRISAADLAIAVIDELEHPNTEQHFTVCAAADRRRAGVSLSPDLSGLAVRVTAHDPRNTASGEHER